MIQAADVSCRRLASLASASLSLLIICIVDALKAQLSKFIVLTGFYACIWPVGYPGAVRSALCSAEWGCRVKRLLRFRLHRLRVCCQRGWHFFCHRDIEKTVTNSAPFHANVPDIVALGSPRVELVI
eukprot:1264370-Pleurochrysis_carterae.AAC.1